MGKGRAPCCDKDKVKRGPWSPQEDLRLITFINKHGHENWRSLPKQAGLLRCGKSCRLRWINYLRPDVKRGNFSKEEEDTIIKLQETLGNKWSKIASHLAGRTDNEIKNVWNTHLKKRFASKNVKIPQKDESKESCMASSSCSFITSVSSSCAQRNIEVELEQQGHEGSANKLHGEDSSISSSNSNITNSSQVDVPNPEEVNKPEMSDTDIDIPWESDSDFWDMLNSLGSFQSDDQIQSNEVENNKWWEYLEIELGLEAIRNENQNNLSNNAVEPLVPEMYDMLLRP